MSFGDRPIKKCEYGVHMTEFCKSEHLCECKPEHRDTQCEFEERTNEKFTEERKLGTYTGYVMKRCESQGKLRDDCNSVFEHKQVLCDKHQAERVVWYNTKCRICGTPHRSCCC